MNPWSTVQTVHGRGYFFSLNTSAPCFLKAFDMGESCPLPVLLRCAQEPGFPLQQKPRKLRGLPLNCSKRYPLPVNGCHLCPLPQERFAFCRVSIAGRIALPLRSAMGEL